MGAQTQDAYWDAVEAALKKLPAPPIEPASVRAELDRMRDDKRPAPERRDQLRKIAAAVRSTLDAMLAEDPLLPTAAGIVEAFEGAETHLLQMAADLDRFVGRPLKSLQRDRILLFWQKIGGDLHISNPWPKPPCGDAIAFLMPAFRYVTGEDMTPDQAKDAVEQYRNRRHHGRKDDKAATFTNNDVSMRIDETKITIIKAE